MFAAASGLEVSFRRDGDFLNRVFATTDFHRALEAPPLDAGVVELITEALFCSLQERFQRDPCSHGFNLWAVVRNLAHAVIRLHAPGRLRGRQSVLPKGFADGWRQARPLKL